MHQTYILAAFFPRDFPLLPQLQTGCWEGWTPGSELLLSSSGTLLGSSKWGGEGEEALCLRTAGFRS